MSVDFKHGEYESSIEKWKEIDNVCDGEDVEQYLLTINEHDRSLANSERHKMYTKRATFYQIAGRTAAGLNSLIFSKEPILKIPDALAHLRTNADGNGLSIFQQSRDVSLDVIKKARAGLFVSYPVTSGELSKEDVQTGNYFATISEYEAEQIINWRTESVGSSRVLSLVVLSECVQEIGSDGFSSENIKQLRVLKLEGGVFTQSLYRKDKKDEWVQYGATVAPTQGNGKHWTEVPFVFVGTESNSTAVDDSMMTPLVHLNIHHYMNSAELEHSVWYLGHPQAWMSGLTQTHIDLMSESNMEIGSPTLLGVPSGERFAIEQAQENTMVRQAMLDKVDAMIGLGARYIQPSGVAKTATESNNDAAVQHSALTLISKNVSDAYTMCIRWVAKYHAVNLAADEGVYALNDDFVSPNVTAQEIQVMVASYLQGALPISDYFAWLQKKDISSKEKTLLEFSDELATGDSMPSLDTMAQ